MLYIDDWYFTVHLPTNVHPKPDEPVINKVLQTAAPQVIKSTPSPVTPGMLLLANIKNLITF